MVSVHRGGLTAVLFAGVALAGCTSPGEEPSGLRTPVEGQEVDPTRNSPEQRDPREYGSPKEGGEDQGRAEPRERGRDSGEPCDHGEAIDGPGGPSEYGGYPPGIGHGVGNEHYGTGIGYPPNGAFGPSGYGPSGIGAGGIGGPGGIGPGGIGGCDPFGNCFHQDEWMSGGPGGYVYGQSTTQSSHSVIACGPFGCTGY